MRFSLIRIINPCYELSTMLDTGVLAKNWIWCPSYKQNKNKFMDNSNVKSPLWLVDKIHRSYFLGNM